jgi:hypothetical protein
MSNTAAEDTKKLLIFVEVVDKPDVHVGVFSTPPGLDKDGTDHIVVSLNKANAATAKASCRVFSTSPTNQVRF